MLATHAVGEGHDVDIVYSPDRADLALIDRLEASGCGLWPSPMRRAVGLHDFRDGLALRARIRALKALDVIHSHSSKAGALARTFGRRPGAAQIYSPHGFYTMTAQAPFYVGPVERLLSRATDRIVAVSQFEADHAESIGIPARKLAVIPNGIEPYAPLPRSEARRALGLDARAFVIGFVGRFADQKDPFSAVAVLDHLDGARSFTLAMIGDGELLEPTREKAVAAPAAHRVVLAGSLPARTLIAAFDCLLCTSRYEGMPVSFLEALNCGVPIVTYDVGGAAELVAAPRSGFVTAHDPSAAAHAVNRIAAMSAQERMALAERCKAAARHFSANRMGNATVALYREVLAAKP